MKKHPPQNSENDDINYHEEPSDISDISDEMIEETMATKLEKVKKELAVCRKEREEYLAGWQRAKADYVNAKRNEEQERERYVKFAQESVLRDFLALADSLDMALKHGADENVMAVHRQLNDLLRRHGVQIIDALGAPFNPAEHEALKETPTEDPTKDGIVIEEFQKGYRLHDRVIRPAKVGVGKHDQV